MCEICYVDEAIKGKIIARNSEFHKVAKSPFGEDDEVGMLNLIDADSRTAILRIGAKQEGIFRSHMLTWSGRRRPAAFAARGERRYLAWGAKCARGADHR